MALYDSTTKRMRLNNAIQTCPTPFYNNNTDAGQTVPKLTCQMKTKQRKALTVIAQRFSQNKRKCNKLDHRSTCQFINSGKNSQKSTIVKKRIEVKSLLSQGTFFLKADGTRIKVESRVRCIGRSAHINGYDDAANFRRRLLI